MKLHKYLLVALACFWSAGAMAQWQWLDKDGRKVFSDRPPQDIAQDKILKQPRFVPAARTAPADTAEEPGATAAAPGDGQACQCAGRRQRQGAREEKAQAEAEEAAKKESPGGQTGCRPCRQLQACSRPRPYLESGTHETDQCAR